MYSHVTHIQNYGHFRQPIAHPLGSNFREFVLIGNLTLLPQCHIIFPELEKLYGVHFTIPKYSEFCTAIGAALCYAPTKA